ncbi:hypothetical protein [Cumulibacter soli]|uniref:hypothetical protein n=1 Tax=Cumulibacter soli TaxID=2546344 RepID=UPI001FBB8CFC|nr:hypothetical protein [Cumulibacter soli]
MKDSTVELDRSMAIPITATSAVCTLANSCSIGISSTQGPQFVAQKLMTVGFPSVCRSGTLSIQSSDAESIRSATLGLGPELGEALDDLQPATGAIMMRQATSRR